MEELSQTDNPSVHHFDLITDFAGELNIQEIGRLYKQACDQSDLQLMPAPFGLKERCPSDTKMQMTVTKRNDGSVIILKHFVFPEKVKPSLFMKMAHGTANRAKYMTSAPKVGRKILQYCLENMGGYTFKCFEMESQAMKKAKGGSTRFEEKADEEIDAGFDFIVQQGPRSSSGMQQLRWQTKQLRQTDSPIFGWPPGLVEKALRNLAADGALARKEFQWPIPLTQRYYKKWVLEMLEKIWEFDQAALVMLGEAGAGKSPLGRSVLMAQVRHNKMHYNVDGSPCIRCTPELDFLRGEQGSILMGDFLDDTSLSNLSMKMVKAFLDVGLYESMCWARWGASKWVQNEPRAVADNTYDADVEMPEYFVEEVPFKKFFEMVRPAFAESATPTHMDAVFKRACFLVNTKTHVYYREAGINTNKVLRKHVEGADFLTQDGKKAYGLFKEGSKNLSPDFDSQVQLEQEWVSAIMANRLRKRKEDEHEAKIRSQIRQGLFGDVPQKEKSITEAMEVKEKDRVRVKREREEDVRQDAFRKAKAFSRQLSGGAICIDLEEDNEPKEDAVNAGEDVLIEKDQAMEENAEMDEGMDMDLAGMDADAGDVFEHGYGLDSATIYDPPLQKCSVCKEDMDGVKVNALSFQQLHAFGVYMVVKFAVDNPTHIIPLDKDIFVFPTPTTVKVLSFDGHFGVHRRLHDDLEPPRTVGLKGRPKKKKYQKEQRTCTCANKDRRREAPQNRTGGWQFVLDPDSRRVLAAKEHLVNENLPDKVSVVKAAMGMAKVNPDALVHDDACHFEIHIKKYKALKTSFKNIKHFVVDEFHRCNHKCKKKTLTPAEKKRFKKESINFWNANLRDMPTVSFRRTNVTTHGIRKRPASK
ncbi:unnamed protein product [Effrenium voratum]|nr:unnamed protein product [Effrenium voratum]